MQVCFVLYTMRQMDFNRFILLTVHCYRDLDNTEHESQIETQSLVDVTNHSEASVESPSDELVKDVWKSLHLALKRGNDCKDKQAKGENCIISSKDFPVCVFHNSCETNNLIKDQDRPCCYLFPFFISSQKIRQSICFPHLREGGEKF